MSITPNPLRWPPGMPIDQPYYKGLESNLARQRIPAMSSQPVGISPRNRGRGRGRDMNPMEQYADPRGRPSLSHQGVPAEEPRIKATEAFLRGLVPGPLDEYPGPLATPGFPISAYARPIPTIPTPGGPYIRPAVAKDAEEIAQLINWYSTTSPLDPEHSELNAEDIHDFLKTCKVRKLPFLVLICPPEMTQKMMGPPTFKIFGVAYIDVLNGMATENSVGDLHIYVRPGYTKKGFGSMLVDCILSICDEYYRRRYAFEWRPLGPVELHVLRLKQLMCNISYPARLEDKYSWTQQWLKDRFGFKDFGQIRQDRAKNGHEYFKDPLSV